MTPDPCSESLRRRYGRIGAVAVFFFLGLLFPRALAFLPALGGLALYAGWPWLGKALSRPRPGIIFLVAAAIPLLAAASAFWSADPGYALERAAKTALVLVPGALWVLSLLHLPGRIKADMLCAALLACGVAALLFLEEMLLGYPFMQMLNGVFSNGDPFRDFDLNRNIVALCLVALPVVAFLYRDATARGLSPRRVWAVCMVPLALMLAILALTQSQSAQLGFLAGFAFMAFFPVRCRLAWYGLSVVMCLGIVAAPFAAIAAFDLVENTGLGGGEIPWWVISANVLPRLEIWDFVSRHILDHIWIGSGIEATRLVEKFDSAERYQPGLTLLHPHNAILQIWMEFGLLGALATCAGVVALLRWLARQNDVLLQRLGLGLLMALTAVGMVGYGLWQGWWLGLILFVTGLCALVAQTPPSNRR